MKTALLILLCALATGCAHPSARQARPPVALPENWVAGQALPTPVAWDWWRSFGSTGLVHTVEEALRQNYDLRVAAARLEAAAAQARIAGAEAYPRVGLSFESARRQQNFVGLPIPGAEGQVLTTRATTHGLSLNTSWELDLWGRVRSGRRAAATDFEVAQEEYEAGWQSLAAQAAKSWILVVEAERQLELARATAAIYQTTSLQVRERYRQGIRSPLDVRLALSSESGASALVAQRQVELETAVRQLEILLGRYPAGALRADEGLPSVPLEVPAGLPSDLLERRPDLLAAERRMAAAHSRVSEAKAALFPRISLTASGGRSSSELTDLLSSQFNVWTLAGNLAQPVFEGGRLRANVQLANARSRESVESYSATVLQALREVETALAAEHLLSLRETELSNSAQQAVAAMTLAQERYRAGIEDFVTLLEAQRRALEAESQLLGVRRRRVENRIDLHLALGGGFRDPTARPVSARNGSRE